MGAFLLEYSRSPEFRNAKGDLSPSIQAVFSSLGDLTAGTSIIHTGLPIFVHDGVPYLHDRLLLEDLFAEPAPFEKTRKASADKLLSRCQQSSVTYGAHYLSSSDASARNQYTWTRDQWKAFADTAIPPFKVDVSFWSTRDSDLAGLPLAFQGLALFLLLTPSLLGGLFLLRKAVGAAPIEEETGGPEPTWSTDWLTDPSLREFQAVFLEVQAAWNQGRFARVARYLSDGVRDRFEVAIRLNAARGLRNVSEQMEVLCLEVVSTQRSEAFERRVIRVRAQARETWVDLNTESTQKREALAEFEELWGMIRVRKKGQASFSLQAPTTCPSCFGSLKLAADSTNCPHCKTLINSGEFGWVISEITQSSETLRSFELTSHPGLRALKQKDPLFETQYLEDRASALLYRIFEARSFCRPELLAPFVVPELLAQARAWLSQPHPKGPYEQLAVGSAQVVEVMLGELDRIRVELFWNAHERVAEPAKLEFVRASSVGTAKAKLLMSFHCPGCGAPESQERDRPTCAHCGTLFNDFKGEWTLAAFKLGDSTDLAEAQKEFRSAPGEESA